MTVVTKEMDTSEALETPEFEGGYVDVNTKGPGRPIQIRPTGTQSNNDIVNQVQTTSSFSKFTGVTSFGDTTSKLAVNITTVEPDGVYTKRDIEDPSRALDRPKAAAPHIPPDGPSTSRQHSVQSLTKPNESKRKRSKDPGDQDCPVDSKVLKVNHLHEAPEYVKAGRKYFKVQLLACGTDIQSTSATQNQRRPSLHQACNVDRPPEIGDTGDVNEPLNLSSRPLDLSAVPKVMIGEPSLVRYGEDQQPNQCTILAGDQSFASVEDPQCTESTMEESDDVNVDKTPGPENAGKQPDADEDNVPASGNPDASFNLPALEILTLESKPSKSPSKKKKEKKDIIAMLKDRDITPEQARLLLMYYLGKRMQGSAADTEGTSNAVEGDIPDFSTLQIETAVTPHEQLMTALREKVTNRSARNDM
ncbi:hypothetical protein ACF0H5_018582 [Mactra antiquata]